MNHLEVRAWIESKKEMWYYPVISFNEGFVYNRDRGWVHNSQEWEVEYDYELMLYTGLKDKNSKKIFEGDICNLNGEIITITNCYGCFWVTFENPRVDLPLHEFERMYDFKIHSTLTEKERCDLDTQLKELEVIGNIWENKDLLN